MMDKIAKFQKEIAAKAKYWNDIVDEMKDTLKIISKPISNNYKSFPDQNQKKGILIDNRKSPHIWLTSDGNLLEVLIDENNSVKNTNNISIESVLENHEQYDTSTWLEARYKAVKEGLETIEKKVNSLSGMPSSLKPVTK